MTSPQQLRFDYESLDTETRRFVLERTERIHNLARMTAAGIVQIGQYLTEVKERLKHGEFLEWIEREFAWTDRHARRFMMVYANVKSDIMSDLEIDATALFLIAAPSTPEPVRAQAIQRAENGETVTHAGTRALVQRFAETGAMPEQTVPLAVLIAERRALMQPHTTPQPPSPSEVHARAQEAELRAKAKVNSERNLRVFNVIGAIECLSGTSLTVLEIAAEIRRLDTPDKDWRGQLKVARRKMAELSEELKS